MQINNDIFGCNETCFPTLPQELDSVTARIQGLTIIPPPPGFTDAPLINLNKIMQATSSAALKAVWDDCARSLTLHQLCEFLIALSKLDKSDFDERFVALVIKKATKCINVFCLEALCHICKACVHIALHADQVTDNAKKLFVLALDHIWLCLEDDILTTSQTIWILDGLQIFGIWDKPYFEWLLSDLQADQKILECSVKEQVSVAHALAKRAAPTAGFLLWLQKTLLKTPELHYVNVNLLSRLAYAISYSSERHEPFLLRLLQILMEQIENFGSFEIRTVASCLLQLPEPQLNIVHRLGDQLVKKLPGAWGATLAEFAFLASHFESARTQYLAHIRDEFRQRPDKLVSCSSSEIAALIFAYIQANDRQFLEELYVHFLREGPTWKTYFDIVKANHTKLAGLYSLELVGLASHLASEPSPRVEDIELLKEIYLELFKRERIWDKEVDGFSSQWAFQCPEQRRHFEISSILLNPLSPPVRHRLHQIFWTHIQGLKAVETHFGKGLRRKIKTLL